MAPYPGDIRIVAGNFCFGKPEAVTDSQYNVMLSMTVVFENVDAFPSIEVFGVSLVIPDSSLFLNGQHHCPTDQPLLCKQEKSAQLQFPLKTKPLAAEDLNKMLEGDPVEILQREGIDVWAHIREGHEPILCLLEPDPKAPA